MTWYSIKNHVIICFYKSLTNVIKTICESTDFSIKEYSKNIGMFVFC